MKGEFTSFYYASSYIKVRASYFKKLKLIENNKIPSHDTLRRIFMYIDAKELRDVILSRINRFITKIVSASPNADKKKIRLISGDGKTFNGSGRKDGKRNM